jgi:hypothetical protein
MSHQLFPYVSMVILSFLLVCISFLLSYSQNRGFGHDSTMVFIIKFILSFQISLPCLLFSYKTLQIQIPMIKYSHKVQKLMRELGWLKQANPSITCSFKDYIVSTYYILGTIWGSVTQGQTKMKHLTYTFTIVRGPGRQTKVIKRQIYNILDSNRVYTEK